MDWSRFDYYARKIGEVGVRQIIRSTFRGVLAALVEYRPVPSDLLPNLQCFRLASDSPGILPV